MSNGLYKCYNGASPTTAQIAPVATGSSLKTMLQLAPPSNVQPTIMSWGISFDGTATTTPVQVELVETDVAASVGTAHVAAGLIKLTDPNGPASTMQLGAALTGYTFTTEGTTTTSRLFDYQLVQPTNQYVWEFPLGREPVVGVSKFLRVRLKAASTVNCVCWITWEE